MAIFLKKITILLSFCIELPVFAGYIFEIDRQEGELLKILAK